MENTANGIIAHYEHHALSWDADRRAGGWADKPYIERFLGHLPKGATAQIATPELHWYDCRSRQPCRIKG
jgi:hypothetical protein